MTALQITLRVIHIICGVFWVGSALFLAVFLGPALRDIGPDGGKVVAALVKRGLAKVIPIAAILTVGAGIWLYSRDSVGFQMAYLRSGPGLAFGIGGLFAIASLGHGASVLGPTMEKIAAHAEMPVPADQAARDAHEAARRALGARAGKASRMVAWFMVFALIGMSIARYL